MGKNSGVGWTDNTWNPWRGCFKVSPGCKACYMYRDAKRFGRQPNVVVRSKTTFNDPLKWKEPAKVFTCSWSDFFIEEADEWRDDAWRVIQNTPQHTYQVLTKRSESILERLPIDWGDGYPNVWLGVSVESTKYLYRVQELSLVPAQTRWVSFEPALEYVDFTRYMEAGYIDWLVSGGESDFKHPRLVSLDVFRRVRDDCTRHNIPYFHKQHGGSRKVDGEWGGHMLDGRYHQAFPQ